VRGQRLVEAGSKETDVEKASEPVNLRTTEAAAQRARAGKLLPCLWYRSADYMCVLLYGQLVLGAVIDEKETRIAEILVSSVRSFPLMMGKLIGVSLVALTQLGIWDSRFCFYVIRRRYAGGARGANRPAAHSSDGVRLFCALFFAGLFHIRDSYAVVGSMVTQTQEGGQLALPVVLMLVSGLYLSFSIIGNPNSALAFWASMFPFFAPITMLARIVTETPPMWQIALSLAIGFATAVGLIWLASRIYRVGCLMTGKKASIPEVWRWVRKLEDFELRIADFESALTKLQRMCN